MTTIKGRQLQLREKLKNLLWEQNPADLSLLQRIVLRQIQTVALVTRDFAINQSLLRASALTYYTMLSLVPLLALTFALLKAFGVQNLLQPLIIEQLNVGDARVADIILGYINNTQVTQLGAVGLIFLLVAVISLLTNVEKSFNHVWGVKNVRPLLRRFSDYLSVILAGPVLIIGAISMTSTLASNSLVQKFIEMEMIGNLILLLFKVTPFIFMWLAFTGLYVFMSNIKVEWRAAFVGGIVGGTLWQIAQVGYVHFQIGVGRYNAIYGTMAALPIFMVWLYLSWVIVLFGLGVCYAKQNLRTSGRDLRGSEVSRNSFEQIALALLVTLADRFSKGEPALSIDQLAKYLYIPPRLCRSIVSLLLKLGFISELCTLAGRYQYQLGRSAENLNVAEILKKMGDSGEQPLHLHPHPQTLIALETYQRVEDLVGETLQGISLKDLVIRSQEIAETPLTEGENGII
ncbi:tRNA-processing RNAse BN [Desulfuromusa kysingii]|uniref:tRNA-processing RNAse BN n=1 Tax=Desulfuromusa kysingii TaxID=37625 RepID=A0A1H3YSF0_9BACT|nr:YhjD/YihY/BrkB family envelope integrity protein [Desulfuromusa kysingii]SEA14337.1 tRNA-processing RNAse BN [Desulfuromusa kysingii]